MPPIPVPLDRQDPRLEALATEAFCYVENGDWHGVVEDGRLVAIGCWKRLPLGVAGLYSAYVVPEARGRGLHRALIASRCAAARMAGCRLAAVSVQHLNAPCLENYRREGFLPSGEVARVTVPGCATLAKPLGPFAFMEDGACTR